MNEDFERFQSGEYVSYRVFGDLNLEIASLTPQQAYRLLQWLQEREEHIRAEIERERCEDNIKISGFV